MVNQFLFFLIIFLLSSRVFARDTVVFFFNTDDIQFRTTFQRYTNEFLDAKKNGENFIPLDAQGNIDFSLIMRPPESLDVPALHFENIVKSAIANRAHLNTIIYYDPYSSSEGTFLPGHIVLIGREFVNHKLLKETNSLNGRFGSIIEYAHDNFPNTKLSLYYFGHGLIGQNFQNAQNPNNSSSNQSIRMIDSSAPNENFGLAEFKREILDAHRKDFFLARENEHKRFFPLEQITFLSCKMSSIEVFDELKDFTKYILANELPIGHTTLYATFNFLHLYGENMTTRDLLQEVAKLNQQNQQKTQSEILIENLKDEKIVSDQLINSERQMTQSQWVLFDVSDETRLTAFNSFIQSLKVIFTTLNEKLDDRLELTRFLDRSSLQSTWSDEMGIGLNEGIDLGQFLQESAELFNYCTQPALSYNPECSALYLAQLFYSRDEIFWRASPTSAGQTGVWMARHPLIVQDYRYLRFNYRDTNWWDLILRQETNQ